MEVRIDRSRKNRATTSVSETSSGLSTFTATGVPDPRTLPRNTWPMAPRPSSSCSTYLLPKGVSTPRYLRSALVSRMTGPGIPRPNPRHQALQSDHTAPPTGGPQAEAPQHGISQIVAHREHRTQHTLAHGLCRHVS